MEPHHHYGHHPCQGLGFKANWQPALLSLSLAVLGRIQSADWLSEGGGSTFPLLRPYPGWSQVSEAKWEGLVGSQAGACQALGGTDWGRGAGSTWGEGKARQSRVSELQHLISWGKVGLRLSDLKREGRLGCSEEMGQGDQCINLSNKKGRFKSPDKNGLTISESGFGPEIGCCRVVEI